MHVTETVYNTILLKYIPFVILQYLAVVSLVSILGLAYYRC